MLIIFYIAIVVSCNRNARWSTNTIIIICGGNTDFWKLLVTIIVGAGRLAFFSSSTIIISQRWTASTQWNTVIVVYARLALSSADTVPISCSG